MVDLQILEGRACESCTACCQFPPIRTVQLQKPANTLCSHCIPARGCSVYDARPDVCRGFYCGWFFLEELSPEWHPSLSGVVIRPERFEEGEIVVLILERSAFLLSETFAGLIGAWVEEGITVSFEVMGPPGYLPAKMAINEAIADAVVSRDLKEMHKVFAWALAYIEKVHTWEADGVTPATTLGASQATSPF